MTTQTEPVESKPYEIKILDDATLTKMSTGRVLNILRIVHARISFIHHYYGHRCCEMCLEYVGNNWKKDVWRHSRPFREYKDRLKAILATREDLSGKKPGWRGFTKRNRTSRRR